MIGRLCTARCEREDGFTLIELLVVVMIIGILAGIAGPILLGQRHKGYDAAVKSDLRNAATAETGYLGDNGGYSRQTPVGADLIAEGFKYSNASDYWAATAQIAVRVNPDGSAFCLTSTSASGAVWLWDSTAGVPVANGTCSF